MNLPLYQQSVFLDLHTAPHQRVTFTLSDDVFLCFVLLNHTQAMSLPQAPFGGLEAVNGLSEETLTDFLADVLRQLKQKGIKEVWIKSPPLLPHIRDYGPLYKALGFAEVCRDTNQYLPISSCAFETGLDASAKRRLKKAERAGLQATFVGKEKAAAVYSFLAQVRKQKNIPLSLSWDMFQKHLDALPSTYHLVGVWDAHRLVSACMLVEVDACTLYYFFPANDTAYQSFSPSLCLIKALYTYGQERGYTCLDLGISSLEGTLNAGLFRFKATLGSRVCTKSTWSLVDL